MVALKNSRHFARHYWFSRANDVSETSAENDVSYLGSDASSVWNFCARFSDVISRENQLWRREVSAVFSG